MVQPLDRTQIGSTELRVTRLGIGGAPIGSLFRTVSEDDACATVLRGLELGLNYIDTARCTVTVSAKCGWDVC